MPSLMCDTVRREGEKQQLCDTGVVSIRPQDARWNVHPRAARSGCCAWHLRPLPRLTAGIGMKPEAASPSRVLFYLSECASDLSGRTAHKDPSLKACLLLLSFSSVTLLPVKDENESPDSLAPPVSAGAWTLPLCVWLLRVISASSFFFHGFATQRLSATHWSSKRLLLFPFFFFFENSYTAVHWLTSDNLHSVL